MAGGKRLLSGAKQQPDEYSGHPREGEVTHQHLETSTGRKKKKFLLLLFFKCYLSRSLFFLQLWVRTQIGAEVFWIGLNDRVNEGIWEWSDGTTYIEYFSYVNLILRQC